MEIDSIMETAIKQGITAPKGFKSAGIHCGIKKIKKDFAFDVIHAHFILPDAYAAMNLSSYFNKPLVTTLQATDLDVTVNRNKKCKENIFKVLKHSKAVISPSPRLASQLKNIFGLTSHVIGYGIDVRKVNIETPIDLINKYYDKIVIVSVSRLIDSKGLEYNIKAIYELKDRYPNITYLIIGDGSIKDSLVNLVDGLGLKDYVEFLGELSHKKAMEYIKIATIFSLPSWQETFGLVYLEAMVNEKPVIGCKGQGFDGIIKHCENGFLADSKDVNSIIQIINHILTKPLIAKEIASKGNYTALSNFTFDAIARKISCVYDDVLGKRNIK